MNIQRKNRKKIKKYFIINERFVNYYSNCKCTNKI